METTDNHEVLGAILGLSSVIIGIIGYVKQCKGRNNIRKSVEDNLETPATLLHLSIFAVLFIIPIGILGRGMGLIENSSPIHYMPIILHVILDIAAFVLLHINNTFKKSKCALWGAIGYFIFLTQLVLSKQPIPQAIAITTSIISIALIMFSWYKLMKFNEVKEA